MRLNRCNAHCTRKSSEAYLLFCWFFSPIQFNPFVFVSLAHQFIEQHQSNWSACIESERARLFFSPAIAKYRNWIFGTIVKSKPKPTNISPITNLHSISALFCCCRQEQQYRHLMNSFYGRIADLINTVFGWQKTFQFLFRLKEKKIRSLIRPDVMKVVANFNQLHYNFAHYRNSL